MPSHVHLLFQAKKENPSELIRDLKKIYSNESSEFNSY